MAKTYIADKVIPNYDIDTTVDKNGKITAWVLNGDVNYGTRGMSESLDIWPLLTTAQKSTLQTIYNKMGQLFANHFLN